MPADPAPPRPGELPVDLPQGTDAGLYFIGTIRTPYRDRADCPRQGAPDGPLCRIEVDPRWHAALAGLKPGADVQILYWMHLARRDLVVQNPGNRGDLLGSFAIRSPVRPNPVASSVVRIHGIEAGTLLVRGLDCVDGTPLIDIKPQRCPKA